MSYSIASIELYVRETAPGRMPFRLGRELDADAPPTPLTSPLGHVRLELRDDAGNSTFGCAGDRLSVRWLDKRPGRSRQRKLSELVPLLEQARDVHLAHRVFDTPFALWRRCHPLITEAARARGQVELTAAFASALFERAVLDAVCRLAGQSLAQCVHQNRLGIDLGLVHPELAGTKLAQWLPPRPAERIAIRHTVGLDDPLDDSELSPQGRVGDGLPETLVDYVREDRLRYFKVKVSGDARRDLERLARLWDVLPKTPHTAVTLDANESYEDLEALSWFVDRLETDVAGLFQHILWIEQPLPRGLPLDATAKRRLRRIAKKKRLIIDESDARMDSFRQALDVGYAGTSHKNCKGVYKSLLNFALAAYHRSTGRDTIISAEDLQNLPVVPLQQDLTTVALLGIEHCERNGHHYNYGLSMLSPLDKQQALDHHPDLYVRRGDEAFLRIEDGEVRCASLQVPGFGVATEPDWKSMKPIRRWLTGAVG